MTDPGPWVGRLTDHDGAVQRELRRLIHAATGAVVLLVPLASWEALRVAVVGIAVAALLVDWVRIRQPGVDAWLSALLPVFRATEAGRVSGATWLWLGYGAAVWFPPPASAAGILVGALADPVAAAVGERAGAGRRKSWSGSAAALLAAWLVLAPWGLPWPAVLGAGLVGAAVERWCGPFDDNLLVAPAVAAAVNVLG